MILKQGFVFVLKKKSDFCMGKDWIILRPEHGRRVRKFRCIKLEG